jgi:preprotein translocase subunit SecF
MRAKLSEFFNKNHKIILVLPLLLLILTLGYLGFFYAQNKDIMKKDVSLMGGTTVSIFTDKSASDLEKSLSKDFPDLEVRSLSDNTGKQIQLVVITPEAPEKIKPALEIYFGFKLDEKNSSIEFTGAGLSQDFYKQLMHAMLFAFLLMALVVFIIYGESTKVKVYCFLITLIAARLTFPAVQIINIFVVFLGVAGIIYSLYLSKEKKDFIYTGIITAISIFLFLVPIYLAIIPAAIFLIASYTSVSVPSIAVIEAAFADIAMTLAVVDLLGMKISSAGIIAFLMLIGYSVDTDILLTTKVLRRKDETINHAIFTAFKTGITMTLTAIAAISIALFVVWRFETVLNQIFSILLIGLSFDIFNTWITNTCLIKWYAEKKHRHIADTSGGQGQ